MLDRSDLLVKGSGTTDVRLFAWLNSLMNERRMIQNPSLSFLFPGCQIKILQSVFAFKMKIHVCLSELHKMLIFRNSYECSMASVLLFIL